MQAVYQFIKKGPSMQVKVCGITDNKNMWEVAGLGPHFMGFIFYGPSPRDVSSKVRELELSLLPAAIKKVAVLVNETKEFVREIVMRYGFDVVQLHGEEPPDYCFALKEQCGVIKCFPTGQTLPAALSAYEGSCDMFLFDTATARRGGSGKKFNHHLLTDYRGMTPFLVGGGVAPGDAAAMKALAGRMKLFAGLDLNSRFEVQPGVKDVILLSNFMKELT